MNVLVGTFFSQILHVQIDINGIIDVVSTVEVNVERFVFPTIKSA